VIQIRRATGPQLSECPEAGGKTLLEVPGYRFEALVTNLPPSWSAVAVWRFPLPPG
jgi:hypothetical protein